MADDLKVSETEMTLEEVPLKEESAPKDEKFKVKQFSEFFIQTINENQKCPGKLGKIRFGKVSEFRLPNAPKSHFIH
jgi:hypothetical protein